MKSRKWYIKISYHHLELTLVNSWLFYKRVHSKKQPGCRLLKQAQFRAEAAYNLCNIRPAATKRGRPSNSLVEEIENKRKRGPMKHIPPNCRGFTHTKCEKCDVEVCLNIHNNCFKQFHM